MPMTFGQNLKSARKRKGYSQQEVADYMKVSRVAIGQWENDITMPEGAKIPDLVNYLSITPNDLYGYAVAEDRAEYQISQKGKIAGLLSDQLPQTEQDDLIKNLEEKKRRYDALIDELSQKRRSK